MRREQETQKACLKYLNTQGYAIRIHNTGIYDPTRQLFRTNLNKGLADIFLCYRKRMICIEVKSEKGQLSKEQKAFGERIEENGGIYLVVRSLDELINDFERIKKELKSL